MDVNIISLQKRFHYNEDYFNRIIKKNTGLTFQQLRMHFRLEYAKKLVTNSNLSIDEIAKQCGYQNLGYFYRVFREKYGKTPSKFRSPNNQSII